MPGLLSGVLKGIVGTAFAPVFLPAIAHVPTRVDDDAGISTVAFADVAIKAIALAYNEEERADGEYSQQDVQIIVLQKDAVGVDFNSDYEITAMKPGTETPERYRVMDPITVDPAGATWTMRATPKG